MPKFSWDQMDLLRYRISVFNPYVVDVGYGFWQLGLLGTISSFRFSTMGFANPSGVIIDSSSNFPRILC